MLEAELAFHERTTRGQRAYIKAALVTEGNEDILDRLANISVAREV